MISNHNHRRLRIQCWFLCAALLCIAYGSIAFAAAQNQLGQSSFRIAGIVVSTNDAHPLGRAKISLRIPGNTGLFRAVITGDDGRFEFGGIPQGKYALMGEKRGFISAGYDQHEVFSSAIVTGAGVDTENLRLRLAPAAIITGKIIDESGDPARHANVTLYLDDHTGEGDQIRMIRGGSTDDQGVYEFSLLTPGTYFLSANTVPWYALHPSSATDSGGGNANASATFDRSLDVAYPTTYYADVTDADSATPVPVRGGERLEVDLHLAPVPALHLLFRVGGNGQNGFNLPRLEHPGLAGFSPLQSSTNMISPGVFEMSGIPAGRYNVRVAGAGQGFELNGVDFSKDGEEIDASKGEALVNIRVAIQTAEGLPSGLRISLRPPHLEPTAFAEINAKGEALLEQIPAGKYEVVVRGGSKPYAITHLSAQGAAASGHTIIVGAGTSPSLSLTLSAGNAELRGTVTRASKPFSGAMVVLVPKVPGGNSNLFRRDQSDLDGSFVFRGVLPGSYTVVAIDNGWDLEWSQPGVIGAYLKLGEPVEVGSTRTLKLTDAVEAQPK